MCVPLIPFTSVIHAPTVDLYRWWPPIIVILLRWFASRKSVLPGPTSFTSNSLVTDTPEFHVTRARAWGTDSTSNTRAWFSVTSRSPLIVHPRRAIRALSHFHIVHQCRILSYQSNYQLAVLRQVVPTRLAGWIRAVRRGQ
jgi:hypothetical protein